MEMDELTTAWQSLEARIARSDRVQIALLHDTRLARVRGLLWPLVWGQLLQLLLGVGLIVLGVACWTRNLHVTGLLATGIAVHAFGLLTAVGAAITMALAATLDDSAPVLQIQKRLALLMRWQTLNGMVCGAPWAVMWLLVVVAFAGLGNSNAPAATQAWIVWSFWIGIAGTIAAWAWMWRRVRQDTGIDATHDRADGADGIRRSQRLVREIAEFEQG